MKRLIYAILLFICISCSTTKYVEKEVPIETIRTEYINQLYRDSIYIKDSVDVYINGDTIVKYKYLYIYKYLNRTDTIVKRDSIQVPVKVTTVEVKEVNKIKWYLKLLMWLGGVSIVSLLVLLYFKIKKVT